MSQQSNPHSRTTLTAVVALITAGVALGTGVWENVQMREHNRLSVTPHLQLITEFPSAGGEAVERAIIRVQNEGVGPAVVDSIEVVVTGPDGNDRRFRTWRDAVASLEKEQEITLARRMELGPDVMFGADAAYEVAIFEKPSASGEPLFPWLLERLNYRIFYRSVYGEPFETDLQRQRGYAGL